MKTKLQYKAGLIGLTLMLILTGCASSLAGGGGGGAGIGTGGAGGCPLGICI